MRHKVELYVQPGCADCHQAEAFLREMGIPFESYDVTADPEAYDRLVNRYESRVTATVVIDGRVFRGFGRNREAIARALQD
ncbi:MAG TPA: glutaredoxin domain-containing protein [Thermaerobacter sp.]